MRISNLLAAVVLLGACTDASAPLAETSPTTPAVNATARDVTVDYQEYTSTLSGKVLACLGEPVQVTFRYATRLQIVIDARGGFHGVFTVVDKGSTGVGTVSGTRFIMQEGQQEQFQQGLQGLPATSTANFDRRFISPGAALNFRVHNLAHFTIDANGVTTVDFSESESFCH